VVQKRSEDARKAYKAALEKAEPWPLRETLRLKLEALGEG
jgi:predicted negative regulator of RcsB-dependent stress response